MHNLGCVEQPVQCILCIRAVLAIDLQSKEGYNFLVLTQWMQPSQTSACIAWARETYERMQPFFASGRYVNYLGDDETGDPVAAAYGPNFRRLQQIKAKYDSKNFFRMNQNIRPLA